MSRQTKYKEAFPWVDNIAEVTDPIVRSSLNTALADALQNGSVDRFWLSPPELLDWQDHAGFVYLPYDAEDAVSDIDLQAWLTLARARGAITVDRLKSDRVAALRTHDLSAVGSWSVLRCVVGELESGGQTFVLNEGKWYRVDATFLDAINGFIRQLEQLSTPLPLYGDDDEGKYNARAAATSNGFLVLLDQEFPKGSPYGKIEVCDLYSATKQLIHVKRYRSSGTLSHLFNQGLVSAELLAQDPVFREGFNQLLPESLRTADPQAPLVSQEMKVAYAVIVAYGKARQLPFFSRVALRNTALTFARIGFRVSLTFVPSYKPSRTA